MAFHSTSRATEFPTTGVVEQSCPDSGVATLYLGAQAFVRLIQDRLPDALTIWLAQMLAHENSAFNRFAQGLVADESAVRQALTLPHSTDPVEGHIHRLKLLKRQMYGRAALPLLAARFLYTPADYS